MLKRSGAMTTEPERGGMSAASSTPHSENERLRALMDSVLAFVGVLSPSGVLLEANEPAVAAAGLGRDELIGQPFWDCYWWAFDEPTRQCLREAVAKAARGERVRYDAEIRVVGDGRLWIDFQIVPMFDADGNVTELIPSGVDITERKQAEAHRELLLKELSHRVKNTLAALQSMAGQTLRSAASSEEFRSAFGARLSAIAASHDLLVKSNHENVRLLDLIRGQVLPYAGSPDQLVLEGRNLLLPGDAAHSLGLVLHELATNAAKYGALSSKEGTVAIRWSARDGDLSALLFKWKESGGPPVEPPKRTGLGTRLIERSLIADGEESPRLDFDRDGLSARFVLRH